MGKSQRWVSYRLTFGAFLSFRTECSKTDISTPHNLTEGRFRRLWRKTKGPEKDRFAAVLVSFLPRRPACR
jgi:hypothetical protein